MKINEEELKNIISDTVNMTVLKLKMSGLMKDERKTAFQKTEELLRNYGSFRKSDQPYTRKLVSKMDEALEGVRGEIYFEIIPMYYFQGYTREYIAEYFNTTVTTISRNKVKLINKMKAILFSDDFIFELFL